MSSPPTPEPHPSAIATWRALLGRVRPALPALASLALVAGATYAAPAAASFALGTHVPWALPAALGAALTVLAAPLRRAARARVRPALFTRAAEIAFEHPGTEAEAQTEALFWGVQRAENALLYTLPDAVAAALATALALALAALAAGVRVVGPLLFAGAVWGALALRNVRALRRAIEATEQQRARVAALVAAASRDRGELRGAARADLVARVDEATGTWATAEGRQARETSIRRSLARAAGVAAAGVGLWLVAGVGPREWLAALASNPGSDPLRRLLVVLASLVPAVGLLRALGELAETHAQLSLVRFFAPPRARPAATHPFPAAPAVLELDDATVRYGGAVALAPARLRLPLEGVTAVVGPNGAGKSTLARLITGATEPDEGAATVAGVPVSQIDPGAIALVPQNPVVIESLSLGENARLVVPDASPEAIASALREVGLLHPVGHAAGELSRGEQRRVAIARALLKSPRLLVLDEPDAWLDRAGRTALAELLQREGRLRAVVVATHRTELLALCDRVVVLDEHHTIEAIGTPEAVLARSRTLARLVDVSNEQEPARVERTQAG